MFEKRIVQLRNESKGLLVYSPNEGDKSPEILRIRTLNPKSKSGHRRRSVSMDDTLNGWSRPEQIDLKVGAFQRMRNRFNKWKISSNF